LQSVRSVRRAAELGSSGKNSYRLPQSMKASSETNPPGAALSTARVLSASPAQVFAAFAQAERLAQWWGPEGFTNTFTQFEFKPGGRWVFVMHGPDGASYPNESVFREIQPAARIVMPATRRWTGEGKAKERCCCLSRATRRSR
jgi:hypothetical protein